MRAEARLAELQITLPAAPQPVGAYVPVVRVGDLLFLSGQLPMQEGKLRWQGKVGKELTTAEGYQAARLAALNALAILRQELGSLDRVGRVVRVTGHVASAPGFHQQPQVVNGASELLVELFGEQGRHSRVAVGAAELPLNAPVEMDLIVAVQPEASAATNS